MSATRTSKVVDQQLNGGKFAALTQADWDLILPYLEENERLFGIKVEDLLTVDGRRVQAGGSLSQGRRRSRSRRSPKWRPCPAKRRTRTSAWRAAWQD